MLVRSGIILVKYWFSVSDEEQERRFQARIVEPDQALEAQPDGPRSPGPGGSTTRGPRTRCSATPTSSRRRGGSSQADDKRRARLNCIHHLLEHDPLRASRRLTRDRAAAAAGRQRLRPPADRRADVRARGVLNPGSGRGQRAPGPRIGQTGRAWGSMTRMLVGVTSMLTDLTMSPSELAVAVEERGLRVVVAARAQPHPDVTGVAVARLEAGERRAAALPLLALRRPVRVVVDGGRGDVADPAGLERLPGRPARSDPAGQAGRHARSPVRRSGDPRDRLRLEP